MIETPVLVAIFTVVGGGIIQLLVHFVPKMRTKREKKQDKRNDYQEFIDFQNEKYDRVIAQYNEQSLRIDSQGEVIARQNERIEQGERRISNLEFAQMHLTRHIILSEFHAVDNGFPPFPRGSEVRSIMGEREE